uniref:Activated oncosphere TSO45W-C1 n=1 Tax=Taenia solium TaxID=6204 RepID=Q8MUF8_TAESO|nr:activated oncosphere TSO45W-C1 [Taenia solium]
MASQFHLILLLTSILAGNHKATSCHGGVTVVTTSGSGIASAILGLLFTCTVLVLA